MKYLKLLSILLAAGFLASACTSETKEAATETTAKSVVETTETTDDVELVEPEEITEADLRDPVKQYKRYKTLYNTSYSQNPPVIDEIELGDLAVKEYAELLLKVFDNARKEGYYFEDPEGYEEIRTVYINSNKQVFTEDENGLDQYSEGSTIIFKACEVDDSIQTNSKTDGPLIDADSSLKTYENLVEMQFLDGRWKLRGLEVTGNSEGDVLCQFEK